MTANVGPEIEVEDRRICPDEGACHHSCSLAEACFRVKACGPLSGVFPENRWPEEIVKEENNRER